MNTNVINADGIVGARKIDVSRGSLDGSVSSQWFSRPDDQRFLNLDDLHAFLEERRNRSVARIINTRDLRVRADLEDENSLWLELGDQRLDPTHYSFGQLCARVSAPASNLRNDVPAPVAAIYLQARLARTPHEYLGMLELHGKDEPRVEMRALTGPKYGRVYDAEVVEVVKRVLDDGTWKVPGTINWRTGVYDPNTPVTKQSTTLYASDRDVFIFLVRDQYPIEIGKLDDGSPDYLFPGVAISNSEVGARSLTLETFMLRGVCMNRNLWGVEDKQTVRLRHTEGLPSRFVADAVPRLQDFSNTSANAVAAKVRAAKAALIGSDNDEVSQWLQKKGFGKSETKAILDAVFAIEGRPVRSIWDVVQVATYLARDIPHQDIRIAAERKAGELMNLVSV
jgi:hypothetical protein